MINIVKLIILFVLISELRANILKKKIQDSKNDVIIITDFKADSLSKLISQLKSNSSLKPLSERLEKTIKLSNLKNNQLKNSLTSTNYLSNYNLNNLIKTNDKLNDKLGIKLISGNKFNNKLNDKNLKPFSSFNYFNTNFNQLYPKSNNEYLNRYLQNGYYQNNQLNNFKDYNYKYPYTYQFPTYQPTYPTLSNYDPYKNYNYIKQQTTTFDQNKYLPTNYDSITYPTTISPTEKAKPANSISDIISNQRHTDSLDQQLNTANSTINFNTLERNFYDHPLFKTKLRNYYSNHQFPPSIPYYLQPTNSINKNTNKLNHNSNYHNHSDLTNEFINSLINKLNEKKLLNHLRDDKINLSTSFTSNQQSNKTILEEQNELIKNSQLLTKFEQINNKILTNLLLSTYINNLNNNHPKIDASFNKSLYQDLLDDDSQDRLAESNIVRKKIRRRSNQPNQIVIKKYIQVPTTTRRRVKKIQQRKNLATSNNNGKTIRPLIIKKIETPSIVITPTKLKKNYDFKRLNNYLDDNEDDDLFNYSINDKSIGLNSLRTFDAINRLNRLNSIRSQFGLSNHKLFDNRYMDSKLNDKFSNIEYKLVDDNKYMDSKFIGTKFGNSKFDLNNYGLSKLNDYNLNNFKQFNNYKSTNYEQSINNRLDNNEINSNSLPSYASTNYLLNRNYYLKKNKIDLDDQDDHQSNESNPRKVNLINTMNSMTEFYPPSATRKPYLSSTISYNDDNSFPLQINNKVKKNLIEDKIDDKQDNNFNIKNDNKSDLIRNDNFDSKKDVDKFIRYEDKFNNNDNSTEDIQEDITKQPTKLIIIDQNVN